MKRIVILPNDNQINFVNDNGETDIGRTDLAKLIPRWIHAIDYDAETEVYEVMYIRPGNQKFTAEEIKVRFPELADMIASGKVSADEERARQDARRDLYEATLAQTRRTEEETRLAMQRLIDAGLLTPEGGPVPLPKPKPGDHFFDPEKRVHVHGPEHSHGPGGGHTHD
jgi:hypothetical protein